MPNLELAPNILAELMAVIHAHMPTYEVWAYGSRVKHKAHSGSDLDLVIRNPSQLDKPCAQLAVFRSALEDSNIPILIDVVDWARITESFREEILKGYEVLN